MKPTTVRVRLAAQYLPWIWESIQWIKSNRLLLLFSIWPFFVCLFRCFQRRDVADLVQIWILVYILDLCSPPCRALAAQYLQWRWESIQWIKSNQLLFTKNFGALVWPQWWSFACVSQQGVGFSKKINKRKKKLIWLPQMFTRTIKNWAPF